MLGFRNTAIELAGEPIFVAVGLSTYSYITILVYT